MGRLSSLFLLGALFASILGRVCSCEVKNGTDDCVVEGERTADILHRNTKTIENDVIDQEAWSKIPGQERLFEQQLEDILRSVLENGFPAFGIPSLDPIAGNISIGEINIPGVIKLEYLELIDSVMVGLSNFIVHTLSLQLVNIEIIFNLTFPIEVKANYTDVRVVIGDLIRIKGDGTLNLITNLRLQGLIAIGTFENSTIYIDTLVADIFFDSLKIEISNLEGFSDGKTKHTFSSFIGDIIPELINLMKPYMMHQIIELIRISINALITPLGITFRDVLNCLLGIGNCPFELP